MRRALMTGVFLLAAFPVLAAEWFEGGTLQKAKVAEWAGASAENQLATAGDFIASISAIPDISEIKSAEERAHIKQRAEDLRRCVNEAIAKPETARDKAIAELVVFCTILKAN